MPGSAPLDPAAYERAARRGLMVLTFINLLNYLDRLIVPSLFESLKADPGMRLSDAQNGSLMTGFVVVYMLTSPVFGWLGDRYSRTRLMAIGVAIWSLATMLGGLATGFVTLTLARAAVGIGEAAYGSVSPGIIADYFPVSRRGRMMAVFFVAIPVGSALGYVIGGAVDARWGWRAAFFVAGVPGIVAAFMASRTLDPPRGAQDAPEPSHHSFSFGEAYRYLWTNRLYKLTVLGYAAYTFAIMGLASWMPSFLQRARAVPKESASVSFGAVVVVTGLIGTAAGGWLGDWLLRRTGQAYLWLSGVSTLLALPFAWWALRSPTPAVYWGCMVAAELLLFASTGPVNSAIVNVVPPAVRSTAVAVSIFGIHILGDVPSPPLIGAVSDFLSPCQGPARALGMALSAVPAAIAASGLIWCYAAWTGARTAPAAQR